MRGMIATFVLVLTVGAAQAQNTQQPTPANVNQSLGSMGLWDADIMMEQATINISRRYNLNPEQEEYTRQLLRKRTKEFLAVYEDDLRQILKELFMQQLSGKQPSPEQVRSWGERARSLLEASKKAILDGNMEWRDILNDQQKKVHDIDLNLMDRNFGLLESRFERWQQGEFRPDDWMANPQAGAARPQPTVTNPPQPVESRNPDDYWAIYVKKFIKDYQLDEAQRNSALAVLKDVREKATRFREKTQADRDAARTELQRLIREKAPPSEIREWSRKRRELDKPISELFEELKSRLAMIPTEAQKKRVADDWISRPLTTRPASQEPQATTKPATQLEKAAPATSAPAKAKDESAQPKN
jgi:hypothetical protein